MKTSSGKVTFLSSFEFCVGRGFRVRSFMSEINKSFHDHTSLMEKFFIGQGEASVLQFHALHSAGGVF